MNLYSVTLYAGPIVYVNAVNEDDALAQAQSEVKTTATGIVRQLKS